MRTLRTPDTIVSAPTPRSSAVAWPRTMEGFGMSTTRDGGTAVRFVAQRFTWPIVAVQMAATFHSIPR